MKYVVAVLGVVLTGVIALMLILHRGTNTPAPNAKGAVKLSDYANLDSSVSLTTEGRVVGEEQRHTIRITVSPTERKIEILNGYEENVERSNTYPNTQSAYKAFMDSLTTAGFTRTRGSAYKTSSGVCPLGNTFIYDLSYSGDHILNTWSVTCGAGLGTFAGNVSLTRQLFQLQIPDYGQQTSNVTL